MLMEKIIEIRKKRKTVNRWRKKEHMIKEKKETKLHDHDANKNK